MQFLVEQLLHDVKTVKTEKIDEIGQKSIEPSPVPVSIPLIKSSPTGLPVCIASTPSPSIPPVLPPVDFVNGGYGVKNPFAQSTSQNEVGFRKILARLTFFFNQILSHYF